jgi:putative flippase GtrA
MSPEDVFKNDLLTPTHEIRMYVLSLFNVSQPVININSFTLSVCRTFVLDYTQFFTYMQKNNYNQRIQRLFFAINLGVLWSYVTMPSLPQGINIIHIGPRHSSSG